MNISKLSLKSPPTKTGAPSPQTPKPIAPSTEDAYVPSERSSVSIGAGVLLGISLLGMTACTPPPESGQATTERVVEDTFESSPQISLAKEDDGKPLTELEMRQRELDLREREVAIKERELEVLRSREQGEKRMRAIEEQRAAFEKGERIGKGIGDTLTILDALGEMVKDGANEVLR